MSRTPKHRMDLLPITLVAGLMALPIATLAQTDSRPGIPPQGNTAVPSATAPLGGAPVTTPPGPAVPRPAPAMTPGTTTPAPTATVPTPTPPPTATAGAASAAPMGGLVTIPGTVLHERARMSQIIGARVYNEQNENIGEVDDVLLRGVSGTGSQSGPVAVLQVGGFLGIGARLVLVPLNDLRWNAERERVMLPGATRDSLQSRPAFSYSTMARG